MAVLDRIITQDGKLYVEIGALSEETQYNRDYLRKLAKSDKIDAIQIGDCWLINPEDLERYQTGRKNRHPHAN